MLKELRGDVAGEERATREHAVAERGEVVDQRRLVDVLALDLLDHVLVVGELPFDRVGGEVAVEPENFMEKLAAEAVHHCHDDNQCRDAEHDADK